VTTWGEFAAAAPALAARGVKRFSATRVVMVATLRRDGRPRVSPVEPLIVDGEREAYGRALFEVTAWRPSGDYHLFAVEVEEVAWVRLGGGPRELLLWVPGGPVVSRTPPAEPE
jgi:hypothetical protein